MSASTVHRTSKVAALVRVARKGPFRARELDRVGIPRSYLRRLCDRGSLERVGRGLYRLADGKLSEASSLADVSKRVPHATVGLLSALALHGMTSEVPHAVWLLIDTRARSPKLYTVQLEIVRASGAARDHGVETRTIDGVKVRVTSPAKTVADCFRYQRHVGLEVALAALTDYLRARRGSIDALVAAARADRVLARMRPYLEALA